MQRAERRRSPNSNSVWPFGINCLLSLSTSTMAYILRKENVLQLASDPRMVLVDLRHHEVKFPFFFVICKDFHDVPFRVVHFV